MLLKRLYDTTDQENQKVNGVQVLRAGKRQHFSPDLVMKGMAQGWIAMGDNRIVIKGEGGNVVYRIVRTPGYYCCHDGEPMPDGPSARAYIEQHFKGEASPDQSNPSGYEKINFYDCVKE
jgi:hypothetical protein